MNIISTERITPAADLADILREMKLTSAESKAITQARAKVKTAEDIASQYDSKATCDRNGRQCPLLLAVWSTTENFVADPTEGTAEALATATVKFQAAEAIEEHLRSALEQITTAADADLVPTINSMFDRAEAAMVQQLEAAQGALDAAPGLQSEARAFRAKVDAAMSRARTLREDAVASPLRFLRWELGL